MHRSELEAKFSQVWSWTSYFLPKAQFPHLYNGDGDSHFLKGSFGGKMLGMVPAHSQVPTGAEDITVTMTTVMISMNQLRRQTL